MARQTIGVLMLYLVLDSLWNLSVENYQELWPKLSENICYRVGTIRNFGPNCQRTYATGWELATKYSSGKICGLVRLTKGLHHKLLTARKNVKEHSINQRCRKVQEISEAAAVARSSIQRRARQYRAISSQPSQKILGSNGHTATMKSEAKEEKSEISEATPAVYSASTSRLPVSAERRKLPNVGDSVHVPSLNKQALVLKVDPSKEELLVQAGNMKLRLKLKDVLT